jgi:hypothetical protein
VRVLCVCVPGEREVSQRMAKMIEKITDLYVMFILKKMKRKARAQGFALELFSSHL